ncbi:MAG: peptide chain release factor N(5)-glutamine methyltransferase [Gammaproteobacteria bacterium]|nr:peptide chain release factor N(5)-glutamine methyltransferase [Gammaproteobacteria bacterium]
MSAAAGATAPRRRYDEAVRAAAARLEPVSGSPRLDAELLLAAAAGVPRSAVIAFPERELDAAALKALDALVARRAEGEPLAYLLGSREFFALTLDVGPAVLVPRPETEHLVEEALARLPPPAAGSRGATRVAQAATRAVARDAARGAADGASLENRRGPAVLDLGTGSGALALAVKQQRPDAAVTGADSSLAALAVARANAAKLGLDVLWVESSWFDALGGRRYDAILCNPPYVRSGDPHFDGPLRFEPRAALDGGPDGLDAIREILAAAPRHLEPRGLLLLEHGYDQQAAVAALASEMGFERLAAGRDLAGRERYVVLRKPG